MKRTFTFFWCLIAIGACGRTTQPIADTDAGHTSLGELCDGTHDVRLGLSSGGGQVEITYELTNPYGSSFLFVDGSCTFYASRDHDEGIFSGTLTAADAAMLTRAVHWSMLPALSAETETMSCPDAGASLVYAPGLAASCSCGCDEGPLSAQKTEAVSQIGPWVDRLVKQGERLDAGMVAIAVPMDGAIGSEPAWPLDRSIASIDGLMQEPAESPLGDPARFEDPADTARLRMLPAPANGRARLVQDAGALYGLYMRDELPSGVPAAIDALIDSAPELSF